MQLPAGTRLGPYEIVGRIGAGGMGVVYRARDVRLERTVALKFLSPELTADPDRRVQLQREARAASRLDHPNIGTIYGIEETDDGQIFIAMACYEGETLSSLIRHAPLPENETAAIVAQIAEGLGAAHSKGVIHRDIKPSNLILTREGVVKIIDFGLARLIDQGSQIRGGHVAGTAQYMSPEQAQGKPADGRSDLWALGVVLYEMLTRLMPFQGETLPALLYNIVHETPEVRKHMNERWSQLVERMLVKDPSGRFQNAAAFLAALRAPAGNSRIETQAMLGTAGVSPSPTRPGLRLKVMAATAALAASLAFGWHFIHRSSRAATSSAGPSVSATSGPRQLAVLPFRSVDKDPDTRVATDGLVEVLSSRLADLDSAGRSLRVVAASEVRRRKVTGPGDAVRDLGVNSVVTGSVERNGNDLQLTVNVVEPRTMRQIGTATVSNGAGDFAALEEDTVAALARLLKLDANAAGTRPSASPVAYQQYLEAMGYMNRWDQQGNLDKSIALFQSAVRRDPSFHLGDAGLAEAYRLYYGLDHNSRWVKLALSAANRALAADQKLEPVYVTLGRIHSATGQDELAREEFEHALDLAPRDTEAIQGTALTYEKLGRNPEAEKMFRSTTILRPDSWEGYYRLGNFYFRQRRFSEAEAQYRRVLEMTPDNATIDTNLGQTLNEENRYREARGVLEKALALNPTYKAYNDLANAYFMEGSYAEAAAIYEKAMKLNESDYMVWGNLGEAYANVPALAGRASANFEKAVALAEQEARDSPQGSVEGDIGYYYARLKVPAKARPRLESALALAPKDANVAVNVAASYALLGDLPGARTELLKALKLGTSLEYAKRIPALREIASELAGVTSGK